MKPRGSSLRGHTRLAMLFECQRSWRLGGGRPHHTKDARIYAGISRDKYIDAPHPSATGTELIFTPTHRSGGMITQNRFGLKGLLHKVISCIVLHRVATQSFTWFGGPIVIKRGPWETNHVVVLGKRALNMPCFLITGSQRSIPRLLVSITT